MESEVKRYIIKKDNTLELYDNKKIIAAITKSASRVMYTFTQEEYDKVCDWVETRIEQEGLTQIPIQTMHNLVESALEAIEPKVAKSYKDYRNYKKDFVHMLDDVYQKAQSVMYIGDKENSNTDSALVATKRSLIYTTLTRSFIRSSF